MTMGLGGSGVAVDKIMPEEVERILLRFMSF